MQNKETKNINQVKLFDLIKKTLPKSEALVYAVSEFLGIGSTAAYNRINGNKPISFEETIKLCEHFNITLDSIVNNFAYKNLIQCRYSPLNLTDMNDFTTFVQVASDSLEKTRLSPKGEIILSALDIPIFHLLPYRELTQFKLFSWNKSVYGYSADFDTFVKEKGFNEILDKNYEKILKNYQLIPSTEIWTDNTFDTILKLLNYHFEMKHFSDKQVPLFLCNQLLELMSTLQKWADKGTKGEKEVPFKFKITETDVTNTFIIFKIAEKSICYVKLYTINGLSTSDERICNETENWLRSIAQRSTLISGVSETERFKFFSTQKEKIEKLIKKIHK